MIGIIGGSGLYELEGLEKVTEERMETPFGAPSDDIILGRLQDRPLAFLSRHGRGHRLPPHRLNYRANIWALKKLGVERILSVSAVGSMREDIRPGDVVLVDQFFDRTWGRPGTFFERGIAAHVGFGDPVCMPWSRAMGDAADAAGARVHRGGTYICINGPQFSTRAESKIFRSWGVDVIGMTNMPEARLAREAEICYATLALATDYDCWHESHDDVTVEAVIAVLQQNVALAKDVIKRTVTGPLPARDCQCGTALQHAIMTHPDQVPATTRRDLSILLARRDGDGGGA